MVEKEAVLVTATEMKELKLEKAPEPKKDEEEQIQTGSVSFSQILTAAVQKGELKL